MRMIFYKHVAGRALPATQRFPLPRVCIQIWPFTAGWAGLGVWDDQPPLLSTNTAGRATTWQNGGPGCLMQHSHRGPPVRRGGLSNANCIEGATATATATATAATSSQAWDYMDCYIGFIVPRYLHENLRKHHNEYTMIVCLQWSCSSKCL